MTEKTTRSNIDVYMRTDPSLRRRSFDRTVQHLKQANEGLSEDEISAVVDEAVQWAAKR